MESIEELPTSTTTRKSSSSDTCSTESLSPPDKKGVSVKRRFSDSDSSVSNTYKLTSENSTNAESSEQRVGSESANSITEIPAKTSDWSEHHFPHLQIETASEVFSPYVIFSSFSDFLENQKNKRSEIHAIYSKPSFKRQLYLQYCSYLVESVIDLDYDHIDHVPVKRVHDVFCKTKNFEKSQLRDWFRSHVTGSTKKYLSRDEVEMKTELKERCASICDRSNQLLSQLQYMVNKRQASKPEELSEGMYQELFIRFAKIFGLEIMGDPNVGRFTFQIAGRDITSIPDALILNPSHKGFTNSVLAVVKVKKSYSREEDAESARQLQGLQKKPRLSQHIDYKLKGQHVGQLMSVLPHSVFGSSGIYGFIVQATEVTVVAFAAEEKYLEYLRKGNLPKTMSATVKYSEKCNILSKKGRLDLVNTLFDMAALMEYL